MDTNVGNRWTIKSWDRERARGVVSCPKVGELAFDGSAAMVSDFRLGEAVEIELEQRPAGLHVRRIWPDEPRFAPRDQSRHPSPPALLPDVGLRATAALARIPSSLDFRVLKFDGDLVVQGDDDCFAYGHVVEATFRGVEYVELPMRWDGRSFGLASSEDRAYLAARSELTASTVAVRIVDDARQIFFVTCADIESTTKSG